jgi:two-component system OmpR family response regulator
MDRIAELPTASATILVVDDEPSITDAVSTALRYEGYATSTAVSAHEARRVVADSPPDLILLDVMMPGTNGFTFARDLRSTGSDIPIIFLTAKTTTEEKLTGLDLGDDYITKPFRLEEIVARVGNVLRRTLPATDHAILRFEDLILNEDTHQVTRAGVPITLTRTEFALLSYFMRNPRRVLSKTQILDAIWNDDPAIDPNVVETYVSYLRKKLGTGDRSIIQTIRLVGYALRGPND